MTSQKTTKSTTKPTTKSATNPVKDNATKTTDKKACHCNDNCVRHGDCGCENCNGNHNDDDDSYGRMFPISQRIMGHILSVDNTGLELKGIMYVLDDATSELHMGYKYLEMLSKDKVVDPFPISETKLIVIFKQMEKNLKNCMTQCYKTISDYTTIMQDIEVMKNDGQVWKEIVEKYLENESDEGEFSECEVDGDNDDNEVEW